MNRFEIFALGTGIIGLVADFITIGAVIVSLSDGNTQANFQVRWSASIQTLIVISLGYSWLVVSWFIVRRIYLHFKAQTVNVQWKYWENFRFAHSKAFLQHVLGAVFGLAILIAPILIIFVINVSALSNFLDGILLLIVSGITISLIIVFLMPVIYPDIEADLFTVLNLLNPFSSNNHKYRR